MGQKFLIKGLPSKLTISAGVAVLTAIFILLLVVASLNISKWRKQLNPVSNYYNQNYTHKLPAESWRTVAVARGKNVPLYINHATHVTVPTGFAKIAIVIDDMGVNEKLSAAALSALPKEITMSFLPYGKATASLAHLARMAGHEVMIHLPMQPMGNLDPGPNALYVTDSNSDIAKKVAINLKKLTPLAVGVNNHMGSQFTGWEKGMAQVLNILQNEKFFFLDSLTTPTPATSKIGKNFALPILKRDIFLDHYIDAENINKYLAKTEQRAKKQGGVIAIGHPHPATVTALLKWIPTLQSKGIALVPITSLIKK